MYLDLGEQGACPRVCLDNLGSIKNKSRGKTCSFSFFDYAHAFDEKLAACRPVLFLAQAARMLDLVVREAANQLGTPVMTKNAWRKLGPPCLIVTSGIQPGLRKAY